MSVKKQFKANLKTEADMELVDTSLKQDTYNTMKRFYDSLESSITNAPEDSYHRTALIEAQNKLSEAMSEIVL